MDSDEILTSAVAAVQGTQLILELSLPFEKVNDDGPPLVLTATLSVLSESQVPRFLSESGHSSDQADLHISCGTDQFSLNPHIESIELHLEEMYDSSLTKSGETTDPLEILTMYERLLLIPSDNVATKARLLNKLGDVCSDHHRSREVYDLHRALSVYEDSVRGENDDFEVVYWIDLGLCLRHRSECTGDQDDVDRAIRILEDAIMRTPNEHPDKPHCLKNLGSSLMYRSELLGDRADLTRSVQVFEDAISLMTDGHPDRAAFLNNLGVSLLGCFEQLGGLSHLNRSIHCFEDAVRLTSDGDPEKVYHLNNFGLALIYRFDMLGDLSDLNKSIQVKEHVIQHTPDEDPEKPSRLNNLGFSLFLGFERLGDLAALRRSIEVSELAIRLTHDGHPDRPDCFTNLGNGFTRRYEQTGDLSDLDKSIQAGEKAVQLTPGGHPKMPARLNNLGVALMRHGQLGDLPNLNRSINVLDDAVKLTPDGHPEKHTRLGNLGGALMLRFQQIGDISDLNRSVEVKEEAVRLTSDGHPAKSTHLHNLALSLVNRFQQLGDIIDLDRSIQIADDSVRLTPDGHHRKHGHLDTLGQSLMRRFEQLGDISALNQSIQVREDAVLLAPSVDKPTLLNNLGASLMRHFEQVGDLSLLNRSVVLFEDSVQLIPDEHPDKPLHLSNLGNSLMHRFSRLGDLSDLNRSIKVKEDAIRLTSDGDPHKSSYLNNLGISFIRRFERLEDLSDLTRAIQVTEDAVKLAPDEHPEKPSYLSNLGVSLMRRFERLGDASDLDWSIQVKEDAVKLTTDGRFDQPGYLTNLAISLMRRFEKFSDLSDLTRSIQVARDAVRLTPDGHPEKPDHLSNFGTSLLRHFESLGDLSYLNRSIQILGEATELMPEGHSSRPSCLLNLANSLQIRFSNNNDIQDLRAAILHYSSSAHCLTGSSYDKFTAARFWMQYAHSHFPDQALESCSVAISLISQLAWLGSSIDDRHYHITQAGNVARDAASTAIAAKQYATAMEWLEQGRSVVWSQLFQLRSPVDELHQVRPDFADKLRSLSSQLEGSVSPQTPTAQQNMPQADYHKFVHEREELLTEIRKLPGFNRFLLPMTLSQLLPAANRGPVVMLNISKFGCDALALTPGRDDVLHISLDLTFDLASKWEESLRIILTKPVFSIMDLRTRLKGIRVPDPGMSVSREDLLASVLEELWIRIVRPILNVLGITKPMTPASDVRRVWWCPTGPLAFLPIHAAGVYRQPDGPKLSDFVVSSYTPTLAALLNRFGTTSTTDCRILTVSLPIESRLPGTAKEVERVAHHAQNIPVLSLVESEATPRRVSGAMRATNWAHFACHGRQNETDPTDSSLLLTGGKELTLAEIIKLRLQNAEFAFLSACETATGDKDLEEEAVHLAAGMLLAGYRGVIATMWTIDDDVAVRVADEIYRRLFREYGANSTRAAEALHFAIKKVREEGNGNLPLFSWLPFIHTGI